MSKIRDQGLLTPTFFEVLPNAEDEIDDFYNSSYFAYPFGGIVEVSVDVSRRYSISKLTFTVLRNTTHLLAHPFSWKSINRQK